MTSTNDESVLAEASGILTDDYDDVYVKTRPIKKEGGKIGVTLTASDNDLGKLVAILESALDRFTALLNERGIKIIRCSVDDAE